MRKKSPQRKSSPPLVCLKVLEKGKENVGGNGKTRDCLKLLNPIITMVSLMIPNLKFHPTALQQRGQIALVQKYSSEKKRPDTPRVLKHPNFHQIFPFPPENNPNSSFEEFSGTKSASLVQHTNKNNAEKPEDVVKSIKSYDSFSPITDISDILVGDKVAFKVSFFEFT